MEKVSRIIKRYNDTIQTLNKMKPVDVKFETYIKLSCWI